MINAALVGIVFFIKHTEVLRDREPILLRLLNAMINGDRYPDELFHNVTVKECLFDGYTRGKCTISVSRTI